MIGAAVNAASMTFKKALIERAMGAELGNHLGYAAGTAKPETATNQRNGKTDKTGYTGEGRWQRAPEATSLVHELPDLAIHVRGQHGCRDVRISRITEGVLMGAGEGLQLREFTLDRFTRLGDIGAAVHSQASQDVRWVVLRV